MLMPAQLNSFTHLRAQLVRHGRGRDFCFYLSFGHLQGVHEGGEAGLEGVRHPLYGGRQAGGAEGVGR
jgi:hypothetical protein